MPQGEVWSTAKLAAILKRIFDALVDAVDDYHGSIIGYSGDAMTCWFEGDDGRAAAAAAFQMQAALPAADVGRLLAAGGRGGTRALVRVLRMA